MILKSITIYGMHNIYGDKTYDFDKITHIVGRNGSGKTTILQAIQFGLLGYIPGTSKKNPDIFKHCNNGKKMYVNLELEDDGKRYFVNRSLEKKGKTIEENTVLTPEFDLNGHISELELPIFNFDDFYNLTPNKLKDWFMKFIPQENVEIDWESELKDSLVVNDLYTKDCDELISDYSGELDDVLNTLDDTENVLDYIRNANEFFKTSLKYKKDEHNRLSATVQSMVYYDSDDLKDVTISDINDKLNELNDSMRNVAEVHEKSKRYEEIYKHYLYVKSSIAESVGIEFENQSEFLTYVDKRKSEFVTYEKNYLEEKSKEEELLNGLKNYDLSIRNELDLYSFVDSDDNKCPVLGTVCDLLSEKIEESKSKYEELLSKETEVRTHIYESEDRLYSLNEEYKIKFYEIDMLTSQHISFYDAEFDLNNYSDYKGKDSNSELEEIKEKIKYYGDLVAKLKVNEEYESLYNTIITGKFKIEQEIECLKIWSKHTDVNGMQTKYAGNNVFSYLEEHMKEIISDLFGTDSKPSFEVSTKSNAFSFGINRDGTYIPYNLLSSGEKCMYSIALFTTLCKMSVSKLKIIIVDDMFDHLDTKNTEKLMSIISNDRYNDLQYVFASVTQNYNAVKLCIKPFIV